MTTLATPPQDGLADQTPGETRLAPTGMIVPRLSLLADPRSPEAEAYRTLAVNLQYARVERSLQLLLVTSPAAGDGKTTAVANLAAAWAEAGRTVLAVDADLRRPGLHTLLGVDNQVGLTNALRDPDAELPIQSTAMAGLRVLPSGPRPTNPAELLASDRLSYLLDRLRDEAEIVVIDTAPAAVLADASLLAARADGVLLVIGAGRTSRELARQSKDNLERVRANLLGAVMVGVRINRKLFQY